jgi:hypothetical protein
MHSKSRTADVNFKGEKRSNATHASVTDQDARLYKKSPAASAVLYFMGHTLMENRNGLIVRNRHLAPMILCPIVRPKKPESLNLA